MATHTQTEQPEQISLKEELRREKISRQMIKANAKRKAKKKAEQEAIEERNKLLDFQDLCRAIRSKDYPGMILSAIRGACDTVGNTEEYPAETQADSIWNTFCDVAQLANEDTVPDATRLSFAQTLIHAASIAEYAKLRDAELESSQVAENLNLREALNKDRSGVVRQLREAYQDGLITLDDIDGTPAEVDYL